MFFDSLYGLLRVAVIGVTAYGALVVILRFSGKRTLAQLNAFDLVVTVALGSTLASVVVSQDVALTEGILASVVLVGLQFAVAWATIRWPTFAGFAKSRPVVLAWQGTLLHDELRRERVAAGEVRQALRQHGIGSLRDVAAVVLETDGSFSILTSLGQGPESSLVGVRNRATDG